MAIAAFPAERLADERTRSSGCLNEWQPKAARQARWAVDERPAGASRTDRDAARAPRPGLRRPKAEHPPSSPLMHWFSTDLRVAVAGVPVTMPATV
jgi:hypothetical protein